MSVSYLRIKPDQQQRLVHEYAQFKAVVIAELDVDSDFRHTISKWLVESGCLYMMAWGKECQKWDDSVDYANLEAFDFGEIPESSFVMTTWHDNESLLEVFWFAKFCARHPEVDLKDTLLLHISENNSDKEILSSYESV
ncbi:MAG: hypothetical protein AAF446_08375 [Pseudomonadota bacterium]